MQLGSWRVTHRVTAPLAPLPRGTLNQHHSGIVLEHVRQIGSHPADGVKVTVGDEPATVYTADCAPVVIATDSAACVLHISRHTLLKDIIPHALDLLDRDRVTDIYIGPHICAAHFSFAYEGEGVIAFKERYPAAIRTSPHGTTLSLGVAIAEELTRHAISRLIQPLVDPRCTYETLSLPSYRRWLEQKTNDNLARLLTTLVHDPASDTTPNNEK